MKRGILKITDELMAEKFPGFPSVTDVPADLFHAAFLLPEMVAVRRIGLIENDMRDGVCSVLLHGEGLPAECEVPEGCCSPTVTARWETRDGLSAFVGFGIASYVAPQPMEVAVQRINDALATEVQ